MNMGNHCLRIDIRSLEKPFLGKLDPQSHVLQGATVFIVNGEEKMRDFLNRVVKSAGWNTESYSSAESFLNRFESGIPSCLLLDADVPYMGGLRLQAQLQDQDDSLPIIFVSAQGSVPEAVQALQAGATDFIIKPFRKMKWHC